MDNMMRNTAEARVFIDKAGSEGVANAVRDRDAPFGDYFQYPPPEPKPDRRNVITVER